MGAAVKFILFSVLIASMGLAYHSTNALILEREHVSQLEKQMASAKEELKKAQATLDQEKQKTDRFWHLKNVILLIKLHGIYILSAYQ